MRIKTGGIISRIKKIITKNGGNEMAFVTVEDQSGYSIECVVFPKTFEVSRSVIVKDSVVIIEGKLEFKDERPIIIANAVYTLNN